MKKVRISSKLVDTELGLNLLLSCGQLYTQLLSNLYSIVTKCIFSCDGEKTSEEKKRKYGNLVSLLFVLNRFGEVRYSCKRKHWLTGNNSINKKMMTSCRALY